MKSEGMVFMMLSSLFIAMTSVINWLFLHLYCRIEVIGRHNVPRCRGVLLVANHQSMIDSFMLATVAYFPWVLFRMALAPWHPAAVENFFHKRLLRLCTWLWRCIPVHRHQHDFNAVQRMVRCLKKGNVMLFPEGTRTRTGSIGPGRPGVGMVIHKARPVVIPAAVYGMNDVLPVGARFPLPFRKVRVVFGPPVHLDDLYDKPFCKETSILMVERVMDDIKRLYRKLDKEVAKAA
ncbi:1-acyl-sn-glycerol-3-phosphate acyltransferase [bacterium]|nr:1-acyl-sn-glycerol-3-phosphate acyltransferase [candidate division CSSED10-310 bacterium]